MIKLTYYAEWPGERAAGINSGSEEIDITLKYHDTANEDMIEFFRETIAEYFDGAHVKLVRWEARR